MTDRRRRRIDIGLLVLALAGIFTPLVLRAEQQDRRADDQEQVDEWLAERDAVQADLIARNERLIAGLAEVTAQREADAAAFELKVCVFGNDAKRIDRDNDRLIVEGLIDIFALSPHGDATVAMVEATILPRLSTAADDHDCNGDGVIDDLDYPKTKE